MFLMRIARSEFVFYEECSKCRSLWYYCVYMRLLRFFFFSSRRRHTRYWRDWSSDVCSSDLGAPAAQAREHPPLISVAGRGATGVRRLLPKTGRAWAFSVAGLVTFFVLDLLADRKSVV